MNPWLIELDQEMESRGFSVHVISSRPLQRCYQLIWEKSKSVACSPEELQKVGVSPQDAADMMMKNYYGFML